MKKILIITLILIMGFGVSFANEEYESELATQEKQFGINDFIQNSKKYSQGDFFEGMNIKEILDSAKKGQINNSTIYKKILNVFGKEVSSSVGSIISVLFIILIHSIMKAISDNLENTNISQIIYYVQYILIVTIIMTNVSSAIKLVKTATSDLTGFMNMLVPLLISLLLFTRKNYNK